MIYIEKDNIFFIVGGILSIIWIIGNIIYVIKNWNNPKLNNTDILLKFTGSTIEIFLFGGAILFIFLIIHIPYQLMNLIRKS